MDGVFVEGPGPAGVPEEKMDLLSLSFGELEELVSGLGQPAYRAGQLFGWLHKKQAASFDEMTNLPAALREGLCQNHRLGRPEVALCRESRDGTRKYLLRLYDGNCVEAVLMEYQHGRSLCISSQVGCRMGCSFCASTKGGLVRSLSAGEMAGQVYAVQAASGKAVSHIVLMGIGEPLDNFDNVMRFIELITDARGQNLAGRNLSLSTCGLVPQIERLMERRLPLTLSISLHAADDETRQKLMPVAKRYTVAELLAACRAYQEATGRRISYEYAVVPGVNDRPRDAERLAALLKNMRGHVNLIAVNPIEGAGRETEDKKAAHALMRRLQGLGLNATVRRSLGGDIGAACGQLRAEYARRTEEAK